MENLSGTICKAVDFLEYTDFEQYRQDHEECTYSYWIECKNAYFNLSLHMTDDAINQAHNFILSTI